MRVPALQRFSPLVSPPLQAAVVRTGTLNRHTYSFYERPAG
jgi:hypothetical protein